MTTDNETSGSSKDNVNGLSEPKGFLDKTDKIKILIVEDDETTQLLYEKGLLNQVFEIKTAVSGIKALIIYEKWQPDIIVLDINLPEMNGQQVLKKIRTTIRDKKTTIVMVTSLSCSDDVLTCAKQGVEGYIIKPFSLKDIAEKILGYYAKKEPERALKAATLCREILNESAIQSPPDKEGASDNKMEVKTT